MNKVIEVQNLTKDYGDGRGIFNIDLTVMQGEMFGFVGTNGAGKTTTIRHMMGFLKPDSGKTLVKGMDAWKCASEIKRYVGYVPGEIAFPDLPSGIEFLKLQAEMIGLQDMSYANELIERLQLDPSADLRRMSKGMKQKTALVAALMGDPEIILLDEPTTGLDPLMRQAFLDIIHLEHQKGKTIFMSSHMFEELETTCDRVALIDGGKIGNIVSMTEIKYRPNVEYKIEFHKKSDYRDFQTFPYNIIRNQAEYSQVTVSILRQDVQKLFADLTSYDVKFIAEVPYTLEKYFKESLINKKKKENKHVQQTVI